MCLRLASVALLIGSNATLFGAPQSSEKLERVLSAGSPQDVRALQEKLMSRNSGLEQLLLAGTLFAQHNLLRESAELFEHCTRRYPNSFEAHYNLALARLGLNQTNAAFAALREAHPLSDNEKVAAEYLGGKIDASKGDLQNARTHLERAYRSKPDEENYALDLGMVYIRSTAYVPAVEILRAANLQHPALAEIQIALALADVLAGNTSDAIALCRKLRSLNVRASVPALITAFAYYIANDYPSCWKEADLGLAAAQPHPYLHYLRARAAWNLEPKKDKAVLTDLDTAIAKLPSCSVCLALRSRVFEATGRPKQAITDLKRVLGLNAQSPSAWYRLSVLYKKMGQSSLQADALRNYQRLHTPESQEEKVSFRDQVLGGASALSTEPSN